MNATPLKVTVVEMYDYETSSWVWFSATKKSPKEAVKQWLIDHDQEEEFKDIVFKDAAWTIPDTVQAFEYTVD